MVSALDSRSLVLVQTLARDICVVFFGTTLYSCGVFLHPGVQMDTGKLFQC